MRGFLIHSDEIADGTKLRSRLLWSWLRDAVVVHTGAYG